MVNVILYISFFSARTGIYDNATNKAIGNRLYVIYLQNDNFFTFGAHKVFIAKLY